jgi:hypothetical protein
MKKARRHKETGQSREEERREEARLFQLRPTLQVRLWDGSQCPPICAAAHHQTNPGQDDAKMLYACRDDTRTGSTDMPTPIEVLQQAREQMVKARRDAAEVLAKPFDPLTTPQARTNFMQIQATIDHIDKAIVDEKD